jgi:hypothetical protein
MAVPCDTHMVMRVLRNMTPAKLAAVHPFQFQTQPVQIVLPAGVLREMIAYERARRESRR